MSQSNVIINEFEASNFSTRPDNDFSIFSDWIEIYNPGNEAVNLGGYFITDDFQDVQKWQMPSGTVIPAGGCLLFWCDNKDIVLTEFHTNFKMDGGGEEIGLFDPDLQVVDTITYGDQVEDVSYGRKPDGSDQWRYFSEPTPLDVNSTQGYLTNEQPPDPEFSTGSGFYDNPVVLTLSSAAGNSQIRFTTDGSQPDINSQLYSGPLNINETKVIRARCIQNNLLPGDIESRSYFIGEQTGLPVFSLTMNPEFLWDPEIGIYVDEDIQNRTDWERGGKLEYFNADHEKDFVTQVNIRLFGNTAYYYPQKTLAVFPENPLEYQLFESQETDVFTSFLLRSSSDDWPYTMLRDALMQSVVKGRMKLDHQAYSPSVFFINGEYFGIHNIREKINEDYLVSYHNVDPNDIDLVYIDIRDTTITAVEGNLDDFNEMLDFITNTDLSQDENYFEACNLIDIDNYIDFLIANLFYTNTSWHHNVKLWKEQSSGTKWQWLLYDLDRGMSQYYLNLFSVIKDIDTTDLFFPHLNANEQFRNLFLSRISSQMNSTFESGRVIAVIDSLKDKIKDEIPAHSIRWKDECDNQGNCGIQSLEDWYTDVDDLKGYANVAREKVNQYLMDFYDLEGTAQLTIHIEGEGRVLIDGIEYTAQDIPWTYFTGIPINLLAEPDNGNVFLEWEGISFEKVLHLMMDGDKSISVKFGSYCFLPTLIQEDMTVTSECEAYYTQGPVTIESGAALTVQEGVQIFITPGDSIFVYGGLIIEGTSSAPVVLRSMDENQHWGCIKAENSSVKLDHTHFFNCISGVVINGGNLEVLNSTVHYSPYFFSDMFSIHFAQTHIENCIIYGPDYPGKSDVIDCDEISSGAIINNTIWGATDDGIDIGTGSTNVEVIGNRVHGCESMGISVGESSVATVRGNIVSECLAGIQVHSEATANIDHNTLFNNQVSIRCFHYDNQPNSGGHAIVSNTILSQSQVAVYELFENSTISIDYSLCDTEPVVGQGNLFDDPLFVNPGEMDFNLQENSPCIDTGDPQYQLDPDGTRSDIGALFYDYTSSVPEIQNGQNVLIYPNPATDQFYCFLPDQSAYIRKIEIFNGQGKCLIVRENLNRNYFVVDSGLEKHGLFYVRILTFDNKVYLGKVVLLSGKNGK
ncbi:MAG: CotH kinase family protein [Bacteroidales bacterium]|nr:CotH kinase family protein [Bacteroidales bacterium]